MLETGIIKSFIWENILKKPSLSDAMVVLGLTILILTMFLSISFRSRGEELREKQLDVLQHIRASLENSFKTTVMP